MFLCRYHTCHPSGCKCAIFPDLCWKTHPRCFEEQIQPLDDAETIPEELTVIPGVETKVGSGAMTHPKKLAHSKRRFWNRTSKINHLLVNQKWQGKAPYFVSVATKKETAVQVDAVPTVTAAVTDPAAQVERLSAQISRLWLACSYCLCFTPSRKGKKFNMIKLELNYELEENTFYDSVWNHAKNRANKRMAPSPNLGWRCQKHPKIPRHAEFVWSNVIEIFRTKYHLWGCWWPDPLLSE